MFDFTPDEKRLIEYIQQSDAVSIEAIKKVSDGVQPVRLTKEYEIKVARFGIKFCTRVLFKLRDTVHDMGDHYLLTNTYFLDFIDDISSCAKKIHLKSGQTYDLKKKTSIPTNNNFMCYFFKKDEVDLDMEITGVVFGNTVRKSMSMGQKMLYSNAFLSTFFPTFPYIIPTVVAAKLFNVYLNIDKDIPLSEQETELFERWSYITKN